MTSVSKWIPLLLVVTSEFKLCCNFFFFPLGQKPGESWASVVFFFGFLGGFFEESGLKAVVCFWHK